MMKKTWLLALLVGFSAISAACSDDAGDKSKEEQKNENASYALSCVNPDCKMTLEQGKNGFVIMRLKKTADGAESPAAGANIALAKTSDLFMLQGQSVDNLTLIADTHGMITVLVTANQTAGVATIDFSSPDENVVFEPVSFEITVKEAETDPDTPDNPDTPDTPDNPDAGNIDVTYSGTLTYGGAETLGSAEVFLAANKTCAEIAPTGMTSTQIKSIAASSLKDSALSDVLSKTYTIKASEKSDTPVVYAAVARVLTNDAYGAYGCADSVSRDAKTFEIALQDAVIDEPIVPTDTDYRYDGTYYLRSQFNALTLLPHAEKADGQTAVLFKDMLAGDWIEFALSFLSNPEGEITDIFTEQLIPLLFQGEWLKNVLSAVGLGSMADVLTPELIKSLLDSFGVNTIIENLLKELTGQLSWWNTATSSITIVKDLATNFTLEGNFVVNTPNIDGNGRIAGVLHQYDSLLYNNGKFDQCYVGVPTGETDADGNNICRVAISTLDKDTAASSVRGAFTATFSGSQTENTNLKTQADIANHALQLAYGKLIYAALMQAIPQFIAPPDGSPAPSTLGGVLEYYIGYGLATLWNKDEAHADNQITSTSCTAVGEYALKLINEKKDSNSIAQALSAYVSTFGAPVITAACAQGVNALDKLIDKQLGKLTVSNEKINFSSAGCEIRYSTEANVSKLEMFGKSQTWGSAVDSRCKWKVSVTSSSEDGETPKVTTIDGKYWAERQN